MREDPLALSPRVRFVCSITLFNNYDTHTYRFSCPSRPLPPCAPINTHPAIWDRGEWNTIVVHLYTIVFFTCLLFRAESTRVTVNTYYIYHAKKTGAFSRILIELIKRNLIKKCVCRIVYPSVSASSALTMVPL